MSPAIALLVLLVLAVLIGGAGRAQAAVTEPIKYSPAYERCMAGDAGSSTLGMIECINAEVKIQDVAMLAAYNRALRKLNERQEMALRAAQRAWVAFRDADCVSRFDPDWGTMSRVEANACVLQLTAERARHLRNYPSR